MGDKLIFAAVGSYINKKTGKTINFKGIKADNSLYKDILFSYLKDDYIITDSKEEMMEVLWQMSNVDSTKLNRKDAKKYTHTKFKRAKEKKIVNFGCNGRTYFIIEL